MKRYLKLFSLFLIIVLCITGCQNTEEMKQESKITYISLAPHITEIIYALNAQDQLIAVTDYCLYPEDAKNKDKIGGLLNPNIEKMVTLKPTYLFGLPSHEKLGMELKKFGLAVTLMANENIEDVLQTIDTIGDMVEYQEQADQLVRQMKNTLDSLRLRKSVTPVKAVLMIGREKKTLRNITVGGKDTYVNELWHLVGGENIYTDLSTRYGTINLESILLRDPDVIIEFDMKKERGVYRQKITSEWQYLKTIKAVKNKNIFVIGGNHTMIPGPRLIMLAEDFSEIIKTVSIESD